MVITSEGMAAIGVEAEADEAPTSADAQRRPMPRSRRSRPGALHRGRRCGHPAKRGAKAKAAKPGKAAPAEKPAPRRHQAGADDRAAQAPRGRHGRADRRRHRLAASHRIAAPSNSEKLITIEATRTREVGPNKTGAKGSGTVYIVKAG